MERSERLEFAIQTYQSWVGHTRSIGTVGVEEILLTQILMAEHLLLLRLYNAHFEDESMRRAQEKLEPAVEGCRMCLVDIVRWLVDIKNASDLKRRGAGSEEPQEG